MDMETHIEVDAPATTQWLYDTITSLCDLPESVDVAVEVTDAETSFRVKVAMQDLGKIIGKGGCHARAIRILLQARGGKEGCRYTLDLDARAAEVTA